jgi:hypothetical protein
MESYATNCQTLLREAENAERFGADVQKMTAMLRAHWRQDHNSLTQKPGIIKAPSHRRLATIAAHSKQR